MPTPARITANACAELRRRRGCRAPCRRSRRQTIARAIRPPSSGNAGTRLNTRISTFISSSQLSDSSTGVICTDAVERDRVRSAGGARRSRGRRPGTASTKQNVASGPAAAILNSSPGERSVAAHLRQAAEQEQLDPLDLDPLAARDQRVAELVHDQRAEEQQHGRDRRQVGDAVGAVQRPCGTTPTAGRSAGTASGTSCASTPIRIPKTSHQLDRAAHGRTCCNGGTGDQAVKAGQGPMPNCNETGNR